MFTALKEYAKESGHELNRLFMIVDGSATITATYRTAFLGCSRGMCWAHIVKNVDKKLLEVRNECRGCGPKHPDVLAPLAVVV